MGQVFGDDHGGWFKTNDTICTCVPKITLTQHGWEDLGAPPW
jgi:hypothetical protein